jgi:L-alanine-DL-glutamate epimerase-like enolase superfamily enzyme
VKAMGRSQVIAKDRRRRSKRNEVSRREFLRRHCVVPLLIPCGLGVSRAVSSTSIESNGLRIDEISHEYEEFRYRTPYKFGGKEVDRATIVNVRCIAHLPNGRSAHGFGSMPLGNVWSFPSERMPYDQTLAAMKALAERVRGITADFRDTAHPIDINVALEPEYLKAAYDVSRRLQLDEPIPKLCTLVTASAFDAALHDAFGKLHGLSSYGTYGRDFMTHDLSRYLGTEFQGEYLDRYLSKHPVARLALYHSVGASDAVENSDVRKPLNDGLPESLPAWIRYNGLTHIKIKLAGDDLAWDLERVLRIDRMTTEEQARRGVKTWGYSLDFNERCPNVGYLLDFLHRLKEKAPLGFEKIRYIEQPTARDLEKHRENTMHDAAKLRPIVIDESLTGLDRLMLAREMGYTGVALKACKGQSQAVLMAAATQKYKMFRCVQDLTCPGASLVHSVGIAAHVPGVTAVEANARQYMPEANKPWEPKFPGIFRITDGMMRTANLNGPGLGAVA